MKINYQEMEDRYTAPTYGKRGLTIVYGRGMHLYDENGKEYIDCFSNVGVNILGHSVPEINEAITSQIMRLTNLHGSFYNDTRALFSEKLVSVAPKNLTRVFYSNSGTETVEAAIKFARAVTGRKEIIAAKMGYHGKTFGSLSLTMTNPEYRNAFMPLLEGMKHFAYNNVDSLKETISENTAAVILEPIQGEAGIIVPDMEFFRGVKELCDLYGALLIIDEVQTGMGRTGRLFAIEHFGVEPDIMCLAKGLGGGVPIGATLISEKVSQKLFKGCHTNTFGGSPLVCAAGLATLEYIEKHRLIDNARETGAYLLEGIRGIGSPVVRDVRGMGLMIGIELKKRATEYIKALQEKGVLVFPSGTLVIRLLPPLIIQKRDADIVIEKLKEVLK